MAPQLRRISLGRYRQVRLLFLCVFVAIQLPLDLRGQGARIPSDSLLAGITMRGRALAAYDQAAWHATDAVMALRPDVSGSPIMVALQRPEGRWTVQFGRLSVASDTFYVVYEALPTSRPDSFVVHVHVPALAQTGPERLAPAALKLAITDFGAPQRAYNYYVLPRADGTFWVYCLPAQTDATAFPHGADVRYVVASDAQSILEKHQMHRALLNLALPDSAVSGLHTVLVDDVPQDSDVFLVLARRPRRPELIATANYNYQVAVDGSITWRAADRRRDR